MEIRNLISFVHVAELNSFTKAERFSPYAFQRERDSLYKFNL